MASLGDMLRTAREERGISLPDAERETKIRQKYITALEDDNLAGLPGPVYARGFLRNYALYLGLDADEIIDMFDQQTQPTREKIRAARGEPAPRTARPGERLGTEKISIQPLSPERIDTRVRYGSQYIALSLLAIPLIIVFYFVYSAYAGPRSQAVPIPSITPHFATPTRLVVPSVVVEGPVTGAFNTPTVYVPSTVPALTPTAAAVLTGTVPVTGTAGTTAGVTPPAAADITVKVDTTRDAWMRVLVDGVQQFSGTLAKGTTRTWRGKNTIQIRTGRADAVNVTVNGRDIGLMGTPNNQIVEKRWDKTGKETIVSP